MDIFAVAACALAGILIGPLARAAIDQVPERRPVLRRTIPEHGAPLLPATLVPIRSWWVSGTPGVEAPVGSPDDRREGEPTETRTLRWRAPAVDIGCAAVAAILAARVGWSPELPAFFVFAVTLVVVTVIDIDHFRIPDRLVFPAVATSGALLVAAALSADLADGLVGAATGAAVYFAFLFVFFFVYPAGLGFGDVKLALLLGLHLGWAGSVSETSGVLTYTGSLDAVRLVIMGALAGSLLGTLMGIAVLVATRRRGAFPFGPALCAGALVAIVLSESVLA